jgi:hypothetical protein
MGYRAYAGIGSRQTPGDVLELMEASAAALAKAGWVLRSGAAPGADSAFERGCDLVGGVKEIFVPWRGFEGREQVALAEPSDAAYEIAERHHPAWGRLKQGAQKLHARNVHQILGANLEKTEPVKFVLCWTKGAQGEGGTGQALRIARGVGVEVFDLADSQVRERIEHWLGVAKAQPNETQIPLF